MTRAVWSHNDVMILVKEALAGAGIEASKLRPEDPLPLTTVKGLAFVDGIRRTLPDFDFPDWRIALCRNLGDLYAFVQRYVDKP